MCNLAGLELTKYINMASLELTALSLPLPLPCVGIDLVTTTSVLLPFLNE